jgi:acyl-CoA thioesterase FadM
MEPFRWRRRVGFGESDPARIFFAPRALEWSVEAAELFSEAALGLSWAGLVAAGREVRVLSFDCAYERSVAASEEVELLVEAPSGLDDVRVVGERAPGEASFRTSLRLAVADRSVPTAPAPVHAPVPGAFVRVHRVRYGDCGPSGDVYAPRVAEWAVEAAGEWYERTIGVSWIEQCRRGRGAPFLRIACSSIARMTVGTRVAMEVTIPRLGNASIAYRVVGRGEAGATLFEADMAACYISEETGPPRSMPFPDGHRERIRAYQAATGTASR